MTLTGINGQKYQLEDKPFNSGGEGEIYRIVGNKNRVVKIYKGGKTSKSLEEKLTIMANRPPAESVLNQVAWPVDVVYDSSHNFRGFVMPKLEITSDLSDFYKYPPKLNLTYKQKLIVAQNICAVIHEVHKAGYVFGDFNPRNIGINLNTGEVAFLDTDTYHIVVNKAANKAYRCNVCAPGYAAPELLEKCARHISAHPEDRQEAYAKTPLDTFTKETDNFALAIHMFRLMMNGYTPYNGIKETDTPSTASPGVGDDAVKRDNYCFKMGNKPQAVAMPELNTVPKGISRLYHLAFVEGRKDPAKRPSAYDWYQAISAYESELVTCKKNNTHMYRKGLTTCPWCAADERYRKSMQHAKKNEKTSDKIHATIDGTVKPILLIVDTSWSMNGQPLKAAHEWMRRFISECSQTNEFDGAYIGVAEFNSEFSIIYDIDRNFEYVEELNFLAKCDTSDIKNCIEKSVLYLCDRGRMFRRMGAESYAPTIILLTDGNYKIEKTEVIEIKHFLRDWDIISIAVGDYDISMLQTISGKQKQFVLSKTEPYTIIHEIRYSMGVNIRSYPSPWYDVKLIENNSSGEVLKGNSINKVLPIIDDDWM